MNAALALCAVAALGAAPEARLTVLFSGDGWGEVAPCG